MSKQDDPVAPGGRDEQAAGAEISAPVRCTNRRKVWPKSKIPIHPSIEAQLAEIDLLEFETEDSFRTLLYATIDDMGAATQTEQQMAFRRTHQIFKDLRADRLAVTLIDREMRPAAIAVFARLVDPHGRFGLQTADQARELAEAARDGRAYDDVDLVEAGLGDYSIEAEAAVRAFPNLVTLGKITSSNQRDKIANLREFELWRRITRKDKGWQPKSKSPRSAATQPGAPGRGPKLARRVRK